VGQALAHAFARKDIDVTVASRRPSEAFAPQARAIGPAVVAKSLREAVISPLNWGGATAGDHPAMVYVRLLLNWSMKWSTLN
jgi:NAD(P)-dependent dehydrogenase (short-subunit alcohol dehydrogenase family)